MREDELRIPRSTFVRSVIRSLPFTARNRRYVRELLRLEEVAIHGGPRSWAEAMHFHQHEDRHRFEYEAILRELDPEAFAKRRARELEDDARDRAEREAASAARLRALERDRRMWDRCAGRTTRPRPGR